MSCVALFPTERNVFYKEREDGMYGTAAFFVSYQLVELPLNFLGATAFSLLAYFVLGMYLDVGSFFLFDFVIFLMLVQGETVGLVMCSFLYNVGLATNLASVFVTVFNIMAGYFRPTADLPWVLRAINYSLVFQYAAEVLAINEFRNLKFSCPDDQALADGSCPFNNGMDVLDTFRFEEDRQWTYLGILIGLVVVFRIGAFFVLRFWKVKRV
jgi:ABC-type multidrug transport system permease subunit